MGITNQQDKEVQQYRDLVQVPETFEKAFGLKMIAAAMFLGFLMVPGSIYMSLFLGASMGPAAQWVTVILFAEVAKRSMKDLKQQEIFLLFYMTGIALGGSANVQGGLLSQLLWNQYIVQAPATVGMGVASEIPSWVAPSKEVIEQSGRTFFTRPWLAPMALIAGMMLIARIDQFGLGYALYRWTAHVEKLPFPMAPVGALGITALAEGNETKEPWRWRCFSIGGVVGMAFGFVYLGIPAITGALFTHPIEIIPLPWIDFTHIVSSEDFMPAVPFNIVLDLGIILLGMVLPFWAVVGGFLGLMTVWFLNPTLYRAGMLPSWKEGMKVVDTLYHNHIDFYLSFAIGLAMAIFLIRLWSAVGPLVKKMLARRRSGTQDTDAAEKAEAMRGLLRGTKQRGDVSVVIALFIYLFSTITYISVATWLVPGFPWKFFLGFAFIYTPAISYVNAKLEGLVGQTVQIPMVREAAFIFSGYKGAAIWFAPIPLTDYGGATRRFRVMELTGTRISDIIKIELLTVPILMITSLLFCELIWRLAPIPSEVYPFTQEVWDLQARMFALQVTATTEGSSAFLEAIKFNIIGAGLIGGMIGFLILGFLNLPTFLIFGALRGLGQTSPGNIILEMIGALIGRFVLQRRFGHKRYKQYVAVLFAGYSAGVGLVAMASIAIALIVKSTTNVGY